MTDIWPDGRSSAEASTWVWGTSKPVMTALSMGTPRIVLTHNNSDIKGQGLGSAGLAKDPTTGALQAGFRAEPIPFPTVGVPVPACPPQSQTLGPNNY